MRGAARLLAWYDDHRRDLPWRPGREPYQVWLSEIMLQQTRVDTVIPFYVGFLARFPTLDALASAPLEAVLAAWSGLGYYRRARLLHAAARRLVQGAGALPATVAELRALPGFGDYTAAAVASIAFGVRVAAVDGNVERVLARRLGLAEVRRGDGRRRLLRAAQALLSSERPGDSNQALMELGATVCLPRRPLCAGCPLRRGCRGAAEGTPEGYPAPRRRRATLAERRVVAVVEERGRLLLVRRPDSSGLLAGTWELPWVEVAAANGGGAGGRLAQRFATRFGGRWRLGPPAARLRHAITFRRLEVEVRLARLDASGAVAEGVEAGWFSSAERRGLPQSSLLTKALAAAGLA